MCPLALSSMYPLSRPSPLAQMRGQGVLHHSPLRTQHAAHQSLCLTQPWEHIQREIKGRLLQSSSSNFSSVNRQRARIVPVFTLLFEFVCEVMRVFLRMNVCVLALPGCGLTTAASLTVLSRPPGAHLSPPQPCTSLTPVLLQTASSHLGSPLFFSPPLLFPHDLVTKAENTDVAARQRREALQKNTL